VFEKVNEIVNEKFRIYGSKQFHLEDIETPETFLDDIVNYFVSNKIIKMESNYIDFNSFTGEYLTNFSKLFAGFIKQKYKQEAEEIVSNYILSLADLVDNKRKGNLLSFAYQLFSPDKKVGQNPTLDFLVYASLISGELSKFLNYSLIYDKVVEQVRKIEERLNSPYLNYGYFITAKKRGAGIRSIAEMKEVIDIYKKGCVENKDLRLCFCSLYLSKLYLTLLKETEKSVNEVENIIAEISKKLEIVNIAKKYLKIEEKIEEIEKITTIITSLKENFNSYINSLSKKIQEINEEGRTENFKKYLDYLLKVINAEDNLNLYYILFKSIREALNGTLISSEDLRETIFEDIASLSKIGSQLNTIESIVSEIEKIGPELPKLRENIQRKEERISQLIQEIKNLVGDYDSI
jgi:flagellar biosynthesis chaperone FliJ